MANMLVESAFSGLSLTERASQNREIYRNNYEPDNFTRLVDENLAFHRSKESMDPGGNRSCRDHRDHRL